MAEEGQTSAWAFWTTLSRDCTYATSLGCWAEDRALPQPVSQLTLNASTPNNTQMMFGHAQAWHRIYTGAWHGAAPVEVTHSLLEARQLFCYVWNSARLVDAFAPQSLPILCQPEEYLHPTKISASAVLQSMHCSPQRYNLCTGHLFAQRYNLAPRFLESFFD